MKNFRNRFSNTARLLLTMLMMSLGLSGLMMPQVALADIIKQTAKVDGFTKTAKRDCDKVTYTIEVKTLSNGMFPDTITISDNWPAGLLPASAVQFSSTPAVAASTTLTSTGWATTFNTPVGPGGQPVLSSYVITFTSTIDPAALNGGDFKISNQAMLTIKSLPTLKYKSDDPSTTVQGDATTILIPVADVKKCLGTTTGDNGSTKSCLKGDAVVTCGKVAGTFDVTLTLGGNGGVVPTTAQISVLTPGVTIVSPASSYPVIGGKVKLTLAGATPGQIIDFQMDGSSTTPDPTSGLSICCNGKISITIPKDLDCAPKSTIDITKICDPAQHVWIGDMPPKPNMPANGYVAMCHIKVTTTGNVPNPISVSEMMSGTGAVKYMGSSDPWACVPPMVPGNTPMNCTLPGNTVTGPTDTSTIDVKVTFTSAGDVKEAKNCAAATYDGVQTKKACDDFQIGEGTIKVEKKCSPAIYGKYPVGPATTGLGLHADCQITVTTTGPQTGAITVGDNLIGTGTVVNMNAPAPWACTTPNCTVNGAALNQTSSTTVISAIAVFANAGNALEAKNCAEVKVAGKPSGESCTGITVAEKGKLTVIKEASYNGTHITNVNFPIAVTCGGTTTNATFADGTPYVQTNIPVGTSCSVVEGAAPATGLCDKTQTEVWMTTYNPTTPVAATVAGATIKVRNVLTCKSDESTIKVTKVCEPAKEVIGAIKHYEAACKITVTTTGPQTAFIAVNEAMSGGGTVTSAASSTTPAWNCNTANCSINGGALNQTASTSVIDVKVSFPSKGHVSESQNCARLSVGQNPVAKPDGESCTKFTVEEPKTGTMTIEKIALYNGQHITNQAFTMNLTCGNTAQHVQVSDGAPYVQTGVPIGTDCDVAELPAPVPALCPEGQTGSWTTTYAPSEGVTIPATGANITVTNTLNCKPIDTPIDDQLYVKKVVVNHAPGSVDGLQFWIEDFCNSNQDHGQAYLKDGDVTHYKHFEAGVSCQIKETIIPATTACGNLKPVWTTTYSPSQTIALQPNGETVTVTNTLDCEGSKDIGLSTFSVQKEASYNGEAITDIVFPMNVTCGKGDVQTLDVQGGQSQTISDLPSGTTCSVVEGDIPNTGLCPKGTTEQWATSYSPADGSNTTSANSSVVVRVNNVLSCRKIFVEGPKCDGITAQPGKDGSCVCLYRNMSKTSSASCGCAKGNKFIKGKGCVPIEPVCKNGTKFNPARGRCEAVCQKGQSYNVKNNRCDTPPPVCKRNEKFNPKTGKCVAVSSDPVCRAPYKYNAKINKCVEVIKPQGRQCPFPLVPTPLGCVDPGAVIDLFGGGGRRPPKDTGPVDPGPVGTDQSAYCKQNPGRCP